MAVTERQKRRIWAVSAGRCAICKKQLVEATEQPGAFSLLGDVAHIYAKRDGGPRGAGGLSQQQRDDPENLLLLCLDHHKQVDDHPSIFPPERVAGFRSEHLDWVAQKLSSGQAWTGRLQNFFYINVPRLAMLAEMNGIAVDAEAASVTNIRDLQGDYVRFFMKFKAVIEGTQIFATDVANVDVTVNVIGTLLSFECQFRTKNIGKAIDQEYVDWSAVVGDLPHIYAKLSHFKFVLLIDPRWITTSTGISQFTSGIVRFAGVAIINKVDVTSRMIVGSPLLLGHPRQGS